VGSYNCAGNYPTSLKAPLPFVKVEVRGKLYTALIDSGCSKSVINANIISDGFSCSQVDEEVVMMNGEACSVEGLCRAMVKYDEKYVFLEFLVARVFDGCDFLLGIDFIKNIGGVRIDTNGKVSSINELSAVSIRDRSVSDPCIEDPDFRAVFHDNVWKVSWKWRDDKEPTQVAKVFQFPVKESLRSEFNAEIEQWIADGWLVPYDGVIKGTLPLLAVEQKNKGKIRPVMDYRRLNTFLSSHTAEADVCGEKLRLWRRLGKNIAIIDLRKAYLQIHVEKDLWPYQVVYFEGKTYCLTRLGFGLCVAPKVMTSILRKVLASKDSVREGTDSYIDDIIVNLDRVSSDEVVSVLKSYGLESKPIEKLSNCRILGLRVEQVGCGFDWRRDSELPNAEDVKTRRDLFSFCGRAVGHYPCAYWLRPACSYAKRSCNGLKWDEEVDSLSKKIINEISTRLLEKDPVRGRWDIPSGKECVVWCDASSLAIGVVLEVDGVRAEDQSWLRPTDDGSHINVAELESVLKGLSLAVSWGMSTIKVITDSASVYNWVNSILVKDRKIKAKGLSEVLVRRRLKLIDDTVSECGINLEISLVPSCENKADELTRVPRSWLRNVCNVAVVGVSREDVLRIHNLSHFGVERTLYFVKRAFPDVKVCRKLVEDVVKKCSICLSVDPSSIHWPSGELCVESCWDRVACDVTHHGGVPYLSFIDCGPSRVTIWKKLNNECAQEISFHVESLCIERGPPKELLMDNGTVFRSNLFQSTLHKWSIRAHYRNAYRPAGNGIVERIHRTVKRIAARTGCSILMATYWYNVSPKSKTDSESVPANQLFTYSWRCVNIDPNQGSRPESVNGPFEVGNSVYVKPADAHCTSVWRIGTVTGCQQGLSVEVDGIPRHIADIRLVPETLSSTQQEDSDHTVVVQNMDEVASPSTEDVEAASVEPNMDEEANPSTEEVEVESVDHNRPQRTRVRPRYLEDYVSE